MPLLFDSFVPEYEKRLKQIPFPYLTNADGTISTHEMAAEVDADGNWIAFPTIQPDNSGRLVRLETQEALQKAKEANNFKAFGGDKKAALNYAAGGYKDGTVIEEPQHINLDYGSLLSEALSSFQMPSAENAPQEGGGFSMYKDQLLGLAKKAGTEAGYGAYIQGAEAFAKFMDWSFNGGPKLGRRNVHLLEDGFREVKDGIKAVPGVKPTLNATKDVIDSAVDWVGSLFGKLF